MTFLVYLLINITSCPKTIDSKYFSCSLAKPQVHELLQNEQDVCDPFARCEFIVWNTMAKESQWHGFLFHNLWCWFHSNRKWVMLATILQHNPDTFFCSTDCKWYSKFCESSENTSIPINIEGKQHLMLVQTWPFCLWPTNSMWVYFWKSVLHMYIFFTYRLWATLKTFGQGSLITSFPMTNREWVTLYILKGSLITSFPTTASE